MVSRKPGLDFVRSAAILLVLASHFGTYYWELPDYVGLGVLGVELFFVLSGYLIGGILLRDLQSVGGAASRVVVIFWGRRWLRTLPAYYFYLIVYALIFHMSNTSLLARYATFTQNLASPIPRFFDVTWSLTVEEAFYLIFPVLIFVLASFRLRKRDAVLYATAALFLVPLGLRLSIGRELPWDRCVRKVMIYRLDAIMWGVAVALAELYAPRLFAAARTRKCFLAGSAFLLAACGFLFWRCSSAGTAEFPSGVSGAMLFLLFGLGGSMTLPYCAAATCPSAALTAVAYRISLYSYSIYLCHLLILYSTRFPLVALPLIFAAGAISYHIIENPIIRLRDRLLPAGRTPRERILTSPKPVAELS